MSDDSAAVRIKKNRRRIFDAEAFVKFNQAQVLAGRSTIEENRALAMQIFTASSNGNRALLVATGEDVLRNRLTLLELLEPATPDETNFKNSLMNRTRIEALEQHAAYNRKMLEINQRMVDINRALIEVNTMMSQANEQLADEINDGADLNARWLDGELLQMMQSSTATTNDARVTENTARVTAVREKAEGNRALINEVYQRAATNRGLLERELETISDLRQSIMSMREKITANQHRLADRIIQL
jgi:hypothetical protein